MTGSPFPLRPVFLGDVWTSDVGNVVFGNTKVTKLFAESAPLAVKLAKLPFAPDTA
jgi:hypothetical protein